MATVRAEDYVPVSALRPANTSSIVIRASVSSEKDVGVESLSLGDIKRISRNTEWSLRQAIYGLPKGEERTIILQTLNEIAGAQYRPLIERMELKPNEKPPIDEETARDRLPAILELKCAKDDYSKLDKESIAACLVLIQEKGSERVAAK